MLREKKILFYFIIFFTYSQFSLASQCFFISCSNKLGLQEYFSPEDIKIILKQHPRLTNEVVNNIFDLIKISNPSILCDKNESGYVSQREDLLSLFSMFASIWVGFS
ncbi:MAG: hypothetical protein CMP11_06915 [Zetaproteobacteria bacterium]|nr:hypothetical protein [Pseudobdellovibrionaceae bacterium]|tara:strand:+ start:410 stop:730 length:321 start_codon:yes stop_codon:yes gene_type:complete